jgi:hypothetical protein
MPLTSRARRSVGILRLGAGTALVVALGFQIVEKILNNAMIADQYFSYFTIQSSFIAATVLLIGGVSALRRSEDSLAYTVARMSVVAYAVVTAVVYNVLLRGIPTTGFHSTPWPGELMHVWVPIFIVLDWLLSPGRTRLRWTALRIVVVYPLVWLAFTLVRGAITGWYPYPFLEPSTGWLSVLTYVLGIAAFIVGLASLAIAYGQSRARAGYRSGLGSMTTESPQ